MRSALPLLLAALLLGCASTTPPPASAPSAAAGAAAPASPPGARDTHEQLQAVLWVQTSAEYTAIARSTYRAATAALDRALGDRGWSAATEQTGDFGALPPAVILDLDETVLDNSRFQAEQVVRRSPFTSVLWEEWLKLHGGGLVPGAKEFLAAAGGKGVALFFVTNRDAIEEADTVANLVALGLSVSPEQVLCRDEPGWPASSDKSGRRRLVAQSHRVLLLVGDDLNDFLPARTPPAERMAAALRHDDWWGERWYLLPNPLYGGWERALYGFDSSLSDAAVLERKRAAVRGFEPPKEVE